MTAFADDPMLRHVTEQTDRLLSTIAAMDDHDVRQRSLLPTWTRGHVLTHIARNADGMANVASSAITGQVTPMYASAEQRDADIAAGADRSASDLQADVESSAERLLARLAAVPEDQLELDVPTGRGTTFNVADLPWLRVREVTYHHVDLGAGFTFADAPDVVVRAGLRECETRLSAAAPGASVTCRHADGTEQLVTIGDGRVSVRGAAADVLAWFTGRGDGEALTTDGGSLPTLPTWG